MSKDLQSASRDESYDIARAQFHHLALTLGARLATHPLEHPIHSYDHLTIDVAELPCQNPEGPRLLITSGLHGVEGFAGSRVQTQLMQHFVTTTQTPA